MALTDFVQGLGIMTPKEVNSCVQVKQFFFFIQKCPQIPQDIFFFKMPLKTYGSVGKTEHNYLCILHSWPEYSCDWFIVTLSLNLKIPPNICQA